jgi:hypothetical protein
MIIVKAASSEVRRRDTKRNRLVLQIGLNAFRITRAEARKLRDNLNRYKLE